MRKHGLFLTVVAILLPSHVRGFTSKSSSWPNQPRSIRQAGDSQHEPRLLFRCRSTRSTSTCYAFKNKQTNSPASSSIETQQLEPDDNSITKSLSDVAPPLALLLLSQFILFVGVGAIIPSIPLYGKEIGLSSAANGVVISAPAVALLLLAQIGGNYADRARKPAMIGGMLLIAVSDVGTSLANSLPTLMMARLGLGAGRCVSEAGERGMLADFGQQVPALRGRLLSAQQAVVALGIAIGAPIGGIVVEEYGPRASFLCVSAAAVLTSIFYAFLPETVMTSHYYGQDDDTNKPEKKSTNNNDWRRSIQKVVPSLATAKQSKQNRNNLQPQDPAVSQGEWKVLFQQNQWRGLALAQCGASFGFAAKIASIPLLASETLPGGAAGAGLLLSVAGLNGLIGAPIGGWLTDQLNPKKTICLSALLSSLSLMTIPFALQGDFLQDTSLVLSLPEFWTCGASEVLLQGTPLAFALVVILWSIGAAAQGPALTALAQELAPLGAEATSMALPRAAGDGTYIVAPFVLGLVADFAPWKGAECALAGATTLIGALVLAFLPPTPTDDDK